MEEEKHEEEIGGAGLHETSRAGLHKVADRNCLYKAKSRVVCM